MYKIRVKMKFYNISNICIHTPTEDKSKHEKATFYDLLKLIYNGCLRNDMKIIIRDFNPLGHEEIKILLC